MKLLTEITNCTTQSAWRC